MYCVCYYCVASKQCTGRHHMDALGKESCGRSTHSLPQAHVLNCIKEERKALWGTTKHIVNCKLLLPLCAVL